MGWSRERCTCNNTGQGKVTPNYLCLAHAFVGLTQHQWRFAIILILTYLYLQKPGQAGHG